MISERKPEPDVRALGVVDRLSLVVGNTISYVFLISIVVMMYEIIARYLFIAPTIWAHESTIALSAIGFAFGGAYTMQRHGHISITTIYAMFPSRGRAILDIIGQVVILGYLAGLIYGGIVISEKAWAVMQTSGTAWNQPTPVLLKTVLVLGAVLMVFQSMVHLYQALRRLFALSDHA